MARAMKVCGIYAITSPSGRCYVGSSVHVRARWSGHRGELRRGKHHCQPFQRAAEKYGVEALQFTLLCECPREHLRELEQLVIDLVDPEYNSSRSTFEALTDLWQQPAFRAKGVRRASEQIKRLRQDPEFRRKQAAAAAQALSNTHKDPVFAAAHRERASRRLREVVNTPEVKARAAQARRDYWASNPDSKAAVAAAHRERYSMRVMCVETGQVFENLQAAADWAGMASAGCISLVVNGKRARAGGYVWRRC